MTRRSGVTLVEVLVAIFVMSLGLVALLTLFPIGMLRMAQAIRDARSADAAYIADKNAIMQNLRNDPYVVEVPLALGGDIYNNNGTINLPNPDVFLNPYPQKNGVPVLPNADPYSESYAIWVDPIGYAANVPNSPGQHWVGGTGFEGVLRRRPVAFTGFVPLNIFRNFTLTDELYFEGSTVGLTPPGTPQTIGAGILRETRTSWAYLLRRPQTIDRSTVDCTVVVFDKRSTSLSSGLALEEYVYQNTSYFNPNNNTITLDYTGYVPPPVRTGDWILDSTFNRPNPSNPTAGSSHAYFYRVVAAEEFNVAGRSLARFEVQNSIRGFVNNFPIVADPIDGTGAYQGTAIVIPGIAEVFEKGPVRLP